MRLLAITVVCTMGCKDLLGIHDAIRIDAGGQDAVVDSARVDNPPGCYGQGLEQVCLTAPPTNDLTITSPITDGDCMMYESSTVPVCVVAARSITIPTGATVTARTMLPLVLIAETTFDIAGTLDASSHRSPLASGAGLTMAPPCPAGSNPTLHGGGQGGSFGGAGGNGGTHSGELGAGQAGSAFVPMILRAGCSGARGAGDSGGVGGNGGGAVYVITNQSIHVAATGTIKASGAAGSGGASTSDGGGGGGGSGGMIGLDAPMITLDSGAMVFANGGGGGEGSRSDASGDPGAEPGSALTPASGGFGNSPGGDGGAGGFSTTPNGVSGLDTTSGGGGGAGGGAGVVKLYYGTLSSDGAISPPPS